MHRHQIWIAAGIAAALAGCRSRLGDTTAKPEEGPTAAEQGGELGAPPAAPTPPPAPLPAPAPAAGLWDVSALVERVRPAVVSVTTKQEVSPPAGGLDFFFGLPGKREHMERIGLGSGFIIDPAGYVVTNAHVVHGADAVRVKLADERELDAKVVGRDAQLDLALLKLDGATRLPVAQLGTSSALKVGEPVVAVGNPYGLGNTVTTGIVSAKGRALGLGPYDDFIQTDASINPGNSGGPLFNARGEVVGINSAIRAGATGIGFAIPIDALKAVLPDLREKGHVDRGKLGLAFQQVTPDLARALNLPAAGGALVAQVEPGGPAERAGIRPGDVIVSVGGAEIRRAEELARTVAGHAPGQKIPVAVLRGGKRVDVIATLTPMKEVSDDAGENESRGGALDRGQIPGKLGIRVENTAGQGVRVSEITSGATAGDLEEGDVILELDGKPTRNVDELRAALGHAKPGSVAIAKVRRGEAARFAAVPIPAK